MPYFPTAQEWLTQSALLLEARPTTPSKIYLAERNRTWQTRITTKYTISKASRRSRSAKPPKSDPVGPATVGAAPIAAVAAAMAPTTRATLTLKTYNPASGVTLKYKTDKAAEVGRLISSLARLGRAMAGLPEEAKADVTMLDAQGGEAAGAETPLGVATPVVEKSNNAPGGSGQQAGGGQGGKKGKKKGKK